MKKEMISKLNEIAADDFEKAQMMLDGINLVLGTKYGWLGKLAILFYDSRGYTARFKI